MLKIFNLLILVLSVLFSTGVSYANNAPELYKASVNSVLYVETQNNSGSGVIVKDDGTFVTCFHVIEDADYIKVTTQSGKTYKVNGYRYISPKDDIAVLTISTTKKFERIDINSDSPSVGEEIYAIGNPQGIKFVFSNGMINQLSDNKIVFSAPASSGSSGGALINSKGQLIGIISSQYNPAIAQNINFAIPNDVFLAGLEKNRTLNSKNMMWSDFLIYRASKKQLKEYANYAYNVGQPSIIYRYIKPIFGKEDIDEDEYAFWGTVAIGAFLNSERVDEKLLVDAKKWLELSLEKGKHTELSSFGLVFYSILNNDDENIDLYLSYLKKYPKSYKFLQKSVKDIKKSNDKEKLYNRIIDISLYYRELLNKTYSLKSKK